jgi:hypothetical protein
MPRDVAIVYQGVGIGLETTPGTAVPALIKLGSLGFGQLEGQGSGEGASKAEGTSKAEGPTPAKK